MSAAESIVHPLLTGCGVLHGFGVRDAPLPAGLIRPIQVHGREVAEALPDGAGCVPAEADAIVASTPEATIGIVTADCVPILVASGMGDGVAAIHAGWRGLARGVIETGIDTLRARIDAVGGATGDLHAVVGPCIGPCCYEVDAPVIDALGARFGGPAVAEASSTTRRGHARIDLAALARRDLLNAGVTADRVGRVEAACTCCDAARFHSYRRDGAAAGRLLHFIRSRARSADRGGA